MRIQLESGQSSSATHSLTQPSATLNRRYVSRPSNLAIEEAAHSTRRHDDNNYDTPSRLVNLRLHNADLVSSPALAPTTPSSAPLMLEANNVQAATTSAEETSHPETEISNDLALSIAADYTAASLGAALSSAAEPEEASPLSVAIREQQNSSSIDEIARTASESIAAIRAATDPADVAEQISALEKFAKKIKSDSSLPEISELSDTIEKFIQIASKSTNVQAELAKKKLLNAKAQRPTPKITTKVAASTPVVRPTNSSKNTEKTILGHSAKIIRPAVKVTPTSKRVAKKATPRKTVSSAANDLALQKVLDSVAEFEGEYPEKTMLHKTRRRGSAKRFALALGCAAACVAAIIYFVGSNVPDISVRVAAMQTGVDASYPAYIPQGYSLDDINSEDGKISLTFSNSEKKTFSLIEEKSSWDSTALLRNFVEPTWGTNYTTTHEQGITIFLYNSNAAWVNGGVLYKISCTEGNLTKKQLRNIVTSMQ